MKGLEEISVIPLPVPIDSPELQDLGWGEIQAAMKVAGVYLINSVGSVF